MQQLFNFFIKNKTFVLFLLLFSYGLSLTIQSNEYHRSKFLNSSNQITGSIYGTFHSVTQYFNLKKRTNILLEENSRLKMMVLVKRNSVPRYRFGIQIRLTTKSGL